MPVDVEKEYAAISHAETGGEKNPYIRTRVRPKKGSTAFGPAQITGTTAEGANNAGYLKNSKNFYEKEMRPRYEKMNYHGDNKGKVKDYNSRYDYGGDAEFDAKKHGKDYDVFAKEILSGMAREVKDDEKALVRKWRGKDEKQDPEYFKRYQEGKNQKELGDEIVRQLER